MMIGIQWCCIILDWIILGIRLDHAGMSHRDAPNARLTITSPNMIPKQREMDSIVKQIYEAMSTKEYLNSTLLVLCGDHGMNDAGNHGGSAPGETSPALVFISPKLKEITQGFPAPAMFEDDFKYYTTIEQSDIAPTLGALLDFPVPRNNLGAFIPDFLPFWANSKSIEVL
jgi:ethanolaminephosphotransferase